MAMRLFGTFCNTARKQVIRGFGLGSQNLLAFGLAWGYVLDGGGMIGVSIPCHCNDRGINLHWFVH
jgi:hypothetical protein